MRFGTASRCVVLFAISFTLAACHHCCPPGAVSRPDPSAKMGPPPRDNPGTVPTSPLQKLTVSNHTSRDVTGVGTSLGALTPPSQGGGPSYPLNMGDIDFVYVDVEDVPRESYDVPSGTKAVRIEINYVDSNVVRVTFTPQ